MLTLDHATYDAIVAHARRDHPDGACGIVAMRAGKPTRVIEMTNVERSPTFYNMDAGEIFAAFRSMRANGEDEEDFVIYPSHTATDAYPSRTDVSIAGYPEAHSVLVSTRPELGDDIALRSFRITDGVVAEEEVRVASAY